MYKRILFAVAILLLLCGAAACGGSTTTTTTAAPSSTTTSVTSPETTTAPSSTTTSVAETITVTDFRGAEIALDKPAERIVAGLPNVLNNLFMLGVSEEVVGVHQWSLSTDNPDYPFITQIEPRLASGELQAINGNVELIVSLEPDIVILQSNDEIIPTLEEMGVKVYGVNVVEFQDVHKVIQDLGKMTGKEARAQEIVDYTTKKLAAIEQKVSTIADDQKPKGMFVWGPTTLDIAGGVSTGNTILAEAGSKNVAADIDEEHIVATMEQVVDWDPSVIVVWYSDKISVDSYLADSAWQTVSAVSNNQVYMLPGGWYTDLWTPKYQFAILATAKWMYPDLFADTDLEAEQKDMIQVLYEFDFKY